MKNRCLDGKVAIVTGGFSGIGKATVKIFAKEGAKVIAADCNADVKQTVEDEFKEDGLNVITFLADQSKEEDWKSLIKLAEEKFGGLNILVICAGISIRYQLSEMVLEDWDKILAVNLTGPMLGMRTALPLMKKTVDKGGQCSIVNIGSIAAVTGHPTTAYAASKWGLRGLSKSAAFEFADYGIRVNCVHPGITTTGIIDSNGIASKSLICNCPQRRSGSSEELANAVLFLASDASSRITGIDLNVDGGSAELGSYWAAWEAAKEEAAKTGGDMRS